MNRSIVNVTEERVAEVIGQASQRLVFVAPGVSQKLAEALIGAWNRLGVNRVSIVLDVDPEVCRLGYGSLSGLKILQCEAAKRNTLVCHHQQGIRICLVISDDTTLVYAPTPLLVEAGTNKPNHPNGIVLGSAPEEVARDVGLAPSVEGVVQRSFGLDAVKAAEIAKVEDDLTRNPPQKFDLARKIRVFNSRFEFVELTLEGCYLSRKTASIPAELIGLANKASMKDRLKSTFKVIGEKDVLDEHKNLSQQSLMDARRDLEDRYLCNITGYGKAILRENKDEFVLNVLLLQKQVDDFKLAASEKLQGIIDKNCETLVDALFPALMANMPSEWKKFLGPNPSQKAIRDQLHRVVTLAFGKAETLLSGMKVNVVYKGVTYESLQDPEFIKAAKAAFPNLDVFHEEYDAAKESLTKA